MRAVIKEGAVRGTVRAIPSKSQLHRLLICAALADKETKLHCRRTGAEDIRATIRCLTALGAEIEWAADGLLVRPVDRTRIPEYGVLDCGESGSTLRFLLPLACALGVKGEFRLAGRLPERPMQELERELEKQGCRFDRPEAGVLCFSGQLQPGAYMLPGNVSSQYITGLLLALPLLRGDSTLQVTGALESQGYVDMTLDALAQFGVRPNWAPPVFSIPGGQNIGSPGVLTVEGDWSNAAFWLCAGAMLGGDVRCVGLSPNSKQGDRAVEALLKDMGAKVRWEEGDLFISSGTRQGVEVDAGPIPDLVPALAAVAAVSTGTTVIRNASRLRLKESDRLTAVMETLNALGAQITIEGDCLAITGQPELAGGRVDSFGDHRIAMMAAIASTACRGPVTVNRAQAVDKSDPGFWMELTGLGKQVELEEEP